MLTPTEIKALLATLLAQHPQVANFEVKTGFDHTDDPSIWVYAVVHDALESDLKSAWVALRFAIKDTLRETVRARFGDAQADRVMVYVRMWLESELEPVKVRSA